MNGHSGQEVPDEDLPHSPVTTAQASVSGQLVPDDDLPQESGQEVNPADLPDHLTADYTTPEQKVKTGLEAAGRGLIGPFAPLAETKLLGVNPEDIANRQESNPVLSGGVEAGTFAGSLLFGTGEAALLAKVGNAAAKAADMGKLGSTLLKGALEGGMFQASDEMSKSVVGQGDPQAPVASALMHTGIASVLGGLGGAAIEGIAAPTLAKIGESKIGTKAAQFLSDMGDRLRFNQENPEMVPALTEQLQNLHSSLSGAREEIYGSTGLKSQNIKRLTQDVTADQLEKHVDDVTKLLDKSPGSIQDDKNFQEAISQWKNAVTSTKDPISFRPTKTPDATEVFQATDNLKRQLQEWGTYEKALTPLSEQPFRNASQGLASQLKSSLENSSTWNEAGNFQKGLNEATSNFIGKNGPNANFVSKFTEKVLGEPEVSPGKVSTYLKQIGKPNAEIKQEVLGNYVDAAEKYQEQINALHESLGLKSPLSSPPTHLIKATLKKLSPGAEAADSIYHLGIPKFAAGAAGAVGGSEAGYREGGVKGAVIGGLGGAVAGAIAPHIAEAIGRRIRNSAVPYAVRVLSSNAPKQLGAALQYAESAAKGASRLSTGIDALFKAGGTRAIDADASESDKQKVHDFISNGEMNRQMQQQANQPPPQQTQGFAHGGEVKKNPMAEPMPDNTPQPVLKSVGGVSEGMPEHAMLLGAAKSRVNNYLNSIRPQDNMPKLAFDKDPSKIKQEKGYQRALGLAVQPLDILNHIKSGTLTSENLGHFKSMWPEIHDHISKKVTERIIKAQMDGERPSYRVRQSLSHFLGVPLDSTLTPQAMQSVQAMYASKSSSPAPQPKKQAKNTGKMDKISKDHYTLDQASAKRATEWD